MRVMDEEPPAWRLRRATTDDAGALARLHVDCWADAYAGLMPDALLAGLPADVPAWAARWEQTLGEVSRPPTLLAETDDALIGFATAGPARVDDPPAPAELWALYVRAAWWGTAVGHDLFRAVLADGPAYLWVLQGNERAARFYRRQGFAPDGTRKDSEHGRELRMVRTARSSEVPGRGGMIAARGDVGPP